MRLSATIIVLVNASVLLLFACQAEADAAYFSKSWTVRDAALSFKACSATPVVEFFDSPSGGHFVFSCGANDITVNSFAFRSLDATTGALACHPGNQHLQAVSLFYLPPIFFNSTSANGSLSFANIATCKSLLIDSTPDASILFAVGKSTFGVLHNSAGEQSIVLTTASLDMEGPQRHFPTDLSSLDAGITPIFIDSVESRTLPSTPVMVAVGASATVSSAVMVVTRKGTLWSTPYTTAMGALSAWDVGGGIAIFASGSNALFCVPYVSVPHAKTVSLTSKSICRRADAAEGEVANIICVRSVSSSHELVVVDGRSCSIKRHVPLGIHDEITTVTMQGSYGAEAFVISTGTYTSIVTLDGDESYQGWSVMGTQYCNAVSSNHTTVAVAVQNPSPGVCVYTIRELRTLGCWFETQFDALTQGIDPSFVVIKFNQIQAEGGSVTKVDVMESLTNSVGTRSPSHSSTANVTLTPTISPAPTLTPTESPVPSMSQSVSVGTRSRSTSPSESHSSTANVTLTPTISAAPTRSTSPSESHSSTANVTLTPTSSPVPTVTPTDSTSPSVSQSRTTSLTVSPTNSSTPTVSIPPTATTTPSRSSSKLTSSGTRSPSLSTLPTASATSSDSESLFCWGVDGSECSKRGSQCAVSSLTGGCVPVAQASIQCADLSGRLLGELCLPSFSPRCQNCGASWGICRSPEFSCPKMCSALTNEQECHFAKECRWVGSFCSTSECFSFLEPNYTVLPLVLYLFSCVKASAVILLSSMFGRYFSRMWVSRSVWRKKQVPLVATDQTPMLANDSPLRRLFTEAFWFEKYVERFLQEKLQVAHPTVAEIDLTAYLLVKKNCIFTLNEQQESPTDRAPPPLGTDGIGVMSMEDSRLDRSRLIEFVKTTETGRHTVYYFPSLNISRRIQGAVDVFPGTLWLALYNFGAFVVLGIGIFEALHVQQQSKLVGIAKGNHTSTNATGTGHGGSADGESPLHITNSIVFQLVGFRFINSSLPVTAALVLAKYVRSVLGSRAYKKSNAENWTMTKRIAAIRHREENLMHVLAITYFATFLPFFWLSLYGSGLYWYISLPLIAGVIIVPLVFHYFIIPKVQNFGRALKGEEEHLLSSINQHDSQRSATEKSKVRFRELVTRDSLSTNFNYMQLQEEEAGVSSSPRRVASRRRHLRALSAMLSFLSFDLVWAALLGALIQMSLNYALMKINEETFGLHNNQVPSTEWSARSYACLEYIVYYDVHNFARNLRKKMQLVVALVPFA